MSTHTRFPIVTVAFVFVALTMVAPGAFADGTETLGPQIGVQATTGTGIVAAGVGLDHSGTATVNFAVPAGAIVKKAFVYWEGQTQYGHSLDYQFSINGTPIVASDPLDASDGGDRIGAPILFFSFGGASPRQVQTSAVPAASALPRRNLRTKISLAVPTDIYAVAYRYDITAENFVVPGPNSLTIEGLDGFGYVTDGAGVLVVYEVPGVPLATIDIRDGIDLAFINFPEPKKSTVPQTFTFPAANVPRTATLSMFFSSVEGSTSGYGFRPNSIEVTVGGTTGLYSNLLDSDDGPEWDTETIPVVIPPGATSLTVHPFSRNDQTTSDLPASFFWLAAGLSVPAPPDEPGGEGCTPGYWKQRQHFGSWPAPYKPSTMFKEVFEGAFPGKTLLQVLSLGGGGLNALGRHTVAALLNAASEDVSYDLTAEQIIRMFNGAYPGTPAQYEQVKKVFAGYNERHCPLGRCEAEEAVSTAEPALQNYPNPFNPETSIRFSLKQGGDVQLRVYNALGQLVRTLASGWHESGVHAVRWDGRNDGGHALPSGMYICQLRTTERIEVLKLNLVK